jgi:hypothetical protein
MGDIVGSRAFDNGSAMAEAFAAAVESANTTFADKIRSPLTITLGDEFQGLAAGYAAAFEIGNWLRLALLIQQIPCRMALGFAALVTPVNPTRAWGMNGLGFAEVRTALNRKSTLTAYQLLVPPMPGRGRLLDAIAVGLTQMEENWTIRQTAAVQAFLAGGRVEAMARTQGISDRAVRKQLQSAGVQRYAFMRSEVLEALHFRDTQN